MTPLGPIEIYFNNWIKLSKKEKLPKNNNHENWERKRFKHN